MCHRLERHGYALFSRVGAVNAEYIIEKDGVAHYYVGPGNLAGHRKPDGQKLSKRISAVIGDGPLRGRTQGSSAVGVEAP